MAMFLIRSIGRFSIVCPLFWEATAALYRRERLTVLVIGSVKCGVTMTFCGVIRTRERVDDRRTDQDLRMCRAAIGSISVSPNVDISKRKSFEEEKILLHVIVNQVKSDDVSKMRRLKDFYAKMRKIYAKQNNLLCENEISNCKTG